MSAFSAHMVAPPFTPGMGAGPALPTARPTTDDKICISAGTMRLSCRSTSASSISCCTKPRAPRYGNSNTAFDRCVWQCRRDPDRGRGRARARAGLTYFLVAFWLQVHVYIDWDWKNDSQYHRFVEQQAPQRIFKCRSTMQYSVTPSTPCGVVPGPR